MSRAVLSDSDLERSSYQDWSGFNVPSTVLAPFYDGSFDPLLKKEQRLLELFRNERHPFYVMGVSALSSASELTHELAHALFFTDSMYKNAVIAAMKRHESRAGRWPALVETLTKSLGRGTACCNLA